jgi:hypothetical protein
VSLRSCTNAIDCNRLQRSDFRSSRPALAGAIPCPTWPNGSSPMTSSSACSRWLRLTAWRALPGYSPASRGPTPIGTRLGAPSWIVATPSSAPAPSLVSRQLRFTRAPEHVCDRVPRSCEACHLPSGSERGVRRCCRALRITLRRAGRLVHRRGGEHCRSHRGIACSVPRLARQSPLSKGGSSRDVSLRRVLSRAAGLHSDPCRCSRCPLARVLDASQVSPGNRTRATPRPLSRRSERARAHPPQTPDPPGCPPADTPTAAHRYAAARASPRASPRRGDPDP